MEPKITIITACYNSEEHIEQSIVSVVQQSYDNIEFIIVDGASTDRTLEIVERYRHKIDRIISERDQGIYDAYNKGVSVSSGDYIYFLNSDDYLYDRYVIEKVALEIIKSGASLKMLYGDVLRTNEFNGYSYLDGQHYQLEQLKRGLKPCTQGVFFARALFNKYNLFDQQYGIASDFDFMIKVFQDHEEQTVYFPEKIAVFRLGGLSSNIRTKVLLRKEKMDIIHRHFDECPLQMYDSSQINFDFYKKWLEILLFKQRPISSILKEIGVHDVVLFGTVEMSVYVLKDLQASGIQVHAFLDNNDKRHGIEMNHVPILPVEWLRQTEQQIDAVILSYEGNHDEDVKKQINQIVAPRQLRCLNWKEMISMNY